MRLMLLAVAGCYQPSAPAGAPCDVAAPRCPTGQQCYAGTCASEPPAVDAPALRDATPIDARRADAAPPVDAPPPDAAPLTADYTATVARCIDPSAPAAGACAAAKGAQHLAVDLMDGTNVWVGFVRFDVDAQLAGHPLAGAKLLLTTAPGTDSASDQSGDVFLVTAFTEASLATTAPAKKQRLDASFGPIAAAATIAFEFDPSVVVPGQPLYLGIYPTSGDGVVYWDQDGAIPPRLHLVTE